MLGLRAFVLSITGDTLPVVNVLDNSVCCLYTLTSQTHDRPIIMTETPLYYPLQNAVCDLNTLLSDWFDDLEADHSEWTVVDGEEGDYGAVHYSENGQRVGSKISKGGDDDSLVLTDYGTLRAMSMIRENWEQLLLKHIKVCDGIELS